MTSKSFDVVPEIKHLIKQWGIVGNNKVIIDNGHVFDCPYYEQNYPLTRTNVTKLLATAGFDNIIRDKKTNRTEVDYLTIAFSKELLKTNMLGKIAQIPCKLSQASIAQIQWWLHTNGVDIAASDSEGKHPYLEDWGDLLLCDMQYEDYEVRRLNGFYNKYGYAVNYDRGIALINGQIRRGPLKDKWISTFDFDNLEALNRFLELIGMSLEDLAKWTRVEWSGNPEKVHVFFLTKRPWKGRTNGNLDGVNGLEIKAYKKLTFVSPSLHKGDSKPYRVYDGGTESIIILDELDQRRIEGLLEYFVKTSTGCKQSYFEDDARAEYQKYLDEPTTILGPGSRYPNTWLKACSIFFKWKDPKFKDLDDDQRYLKLVEWHNAHCKPSLFETPGRHNDVEKIWEEVKRLNTGRRQEERDKRAVADEQTKEQAKSTAPNACERKLAVLAGLDDNIKFALKDDIWTRVSEDPEKFIVARRKDAHICRATVSDYEQTQGEGKLAVKVTVYQLNHGTIIFSVFPHQVIEYISPLKFLESPPSYSIVFESQDGKRFTVKGSIEEILARLAEKGHISSAYGAKEALGKIIEAFRDDGRIILDESVDFEGYYYHDGEIKISKIDFDKKHPVRTKEEVIECIKYLEERANFQVWTFEGRTIDRKDVFASALQWVISAPFHFAIKQLVNTSAKKYHKAFVFTGKYDGGKTGLTQEMLGVHGNSTAEDVESIYSVAAGSMSTDAKFGKGVSKTTYPIEISEFARVEDYGRNSTLVETMKLAIENLVVRNGRKGDKYDAPFPGCSPLIINGNPYPTKRGDLLKRMHVINHGEEDKHSRDPNTPFNKMQSERGSLIKILGDWTMRYIYENRVWLLLSRKFNGYDIGKTALEKFYEFGGIERPEWLTRWIVDRSLEELDVDDESLIRSIMYENVLKTLAVNSRSIDFGNREVKTNSYGNEYLAPKMITLTLAEKIDLCINNGLWSWLRKKGLRKEIDQKYIIDASILELFRSRLPELNIQELGAKTGFKYSQEKGGRRTLTCTKAQLTIFIEGEDIVEMEIEDVNTSRGNLGGKA